MHNNILRMHRFLKFYHIFTVPQSHKNRDVSKSARNIGFFLFFARIWFLFGQFNTLKVDSEKPYDEISGAAILVNMYAVFALVIFCHLCGRQ